MRGSVARTPCTHKPPLTAALPASALSHSAILAHIMLNEKLNLFGMLGCVLCINGAVTIVLHAPPEQPIESVLQVWALVKQPSEWGAAGPAPTCCLPWPRRRAPASSRDSSGRWQPLQEQQRPGSLGAQHCLCAPRHARPQLYAPPLPCRPSATHPLPPAPLLGAVFMLYVCTAVIIILWLMFKVAPTHGTSNIFVYVGICSLAGSLSVMSCKVRVFVCIGICSRAGSLSVMSCKVGGPRWLPLSQTGSPSPSRCPSTHPHPGRAPRLASPLTPRARPLPYPPPPWQALGVALKLTFQGNNQLVFPETYLFIVVGGGHTAGAAASSGRAQQPCFGCLDLVFGGGGGECRGW